MPEAWPTDTQWAELTSVLHTMGCVKDCTADPGGWRENAEIVVDILRPGPLSEHRASQGEDANREGEALALRQRHETGVCDCEFPNDCLFEAGSKAPSQEAEPLDEPKPWCTFHNECPGPPKCYGDAGRREAVEHRASQEEELAARREQVLDLGARLTQERDENERLREALRRLEGFAAWVCSLDSPTSTAVEERRRVTLTAIIGRARAALGKLGDA